MEPSEIRDKLIGQHQALRHILDRVSAAAGGMRSGAVGAREALGAAVKELDAALDEHNRDEEALLGGLLASIDAWGKERRALMTEHHSAEHGAIYQAVREAAAAEDRVAAATRLQELVRQLRAHMDHEEQEILSPQVLRDDVVSVDSFGG